MDIEAINGEWFYDDVTPKGISLDGLLPQACKIPLGNMQDFELIHTPEKMAEFQSNDWYRKNWSLADTLMTFCSLRSEESGLVKAYRKEMDKILSCPCDSESCQHDASSDAWPTRGSCRGLQVLHKDLSLYGNMMAGNNHLDEGKFYDVKKEIYRLPDRVIAALAKCCEVKSAGAFAILDELYEKEVISFEARDNLASASAIGIRLRLFTYLKTGKQGEKLSLNSNHNTKEKAPIYHMPTDEELFHFFFVAIPLYDELRQFKTSGIIPSLLANSSFFNDSVITMGHIYCRLLKYDKAIECYERAVRENPENLSAGICQIRLALFATHNTQDLDKIRGNLDNLLGKIVKNFSGLDENVDETTLEFTPLINDVDVEGCRQLIDGLDYASKIYDSSKYSAVSDKIVDQFDILFASKKGMPEELDMLVLPYYQNTGHFLYQHEIDEIVSKSTLFIDEEGLSTRSIHLLNSLGEFLYHQDKLDKAYSCFQRSLSMQYLLYGARPNVNMMTTLHFLSMIAREWDMYEESKIYCESLVQLCESIGGIKAKLLIKETYLELSNMDCIPDETLRYIENGLKVTTGGKNETELLLNCGLYCVLAVTLHAKQSPERAWDAVLNAQACLKDCTDTETRVKIITEVVDTLCKIKKSKEGIELLKEELQKFTLKSQTQEKVVCLKAIGKLCLEQGLAPEANRYYSQAMDNLLNNNERVFHDLECRIGILRAVAMEKSVSKQKRVLDKALFSSAMKLPASYEKCSFLQEIGEFCQSIGEIGDARLCSLEAFRSAMEMPASDKKCCFLTHIGELCESISDLALAQQCYDEALNTYNEESNISKKPRCVGFEMQFRLGRLAKAMFNTDLAQRIYYDRAAVILRQHVATGFVDSTTVVMFLILAEAYESIDRNDTIQLLLESLNVTEIVYGEDKSQEMVVTLLQRLSCTYYVSGHMQNSIKYRERQIETELELYSSNPFLERIVNTLMKWSLTSFDVPSSNDSIERVCDFFLSSLNDKASLQNTTAAKKIAAKCFTFIAVLFYTSSDFEKAKSLNEKASQLFGEVQESVEAEIDQCREICDLMMAIFSSEIILPSHRSELYISLFSIGGPHSDSELFEDEWFVQTYLHSGIGKFFEFEEVKEQARSTLVEEHNTLSPLPIVRSQLDALEHYKSKGEFRLAAEIYASLQPRPGNFHENSQVDTREKLISNAIEAKKENHPSNAIRFLDLALKLLEAQDRRMPEILKLRGECFLSMGHFRSAAIDLSKAEAFYSIETIDNGEDLCQYCEVLIGLIKSEILCNNAEAAWLVCEKGIKLVTSHELKETIDQQVAILLYLGVKCIEQLECGEEEENKLVLANDLYQEALSLFDLTEEVGVLQTIFEVKFLLKNIFPTLKMEDEKIRQGTFMNSSNFMGDNCVCLVSDLPADLRGNISFVKMGKAEPEFLIDTGINCSLKARLLIMSGDVDQALKWLHASLMMFFSAPLSDFMWYFDELLPLLQAIISTKSNAPDQSHSPLQQAVDMCTRTMTNRNKSLNCINQFLITLIIIYRSLGRVQEAMVVAEIGLELTDFMCDNSDSEKLNNCCRMLLHLAQIHQQNSSNPAFNTDGEVNRAEDYYLIKRGRENYLNNRDQKEDMVLCKDLSYASFLCERKRFAEAVAVLEDMRNLDQLLWNKYVYIEYFSCAFYGAGVEKSVKVDGELFTTVGDVLYNRLVRAYVGMGNRKEAVAKCEILTDANLLDVHEASFGKRPSCKPYLVEDCHRQLLSLLSEGDQQQFQNCEFPLSSVNLAKLYYMFGEYEVAAKYFPKDVETSEMLEMKISCLRLAGNELVESTRGDESISFFQQFLEELQNKVGFLDKPLSNQYEILQLYYFANQYYFFRSLGKTHAEMENIDVAIQCYERCIEVDEDFSCGQDIVVTLSELYQTKALTVNLDNEDSRTAYMDLAWELFQKLFQKTAELTTFVELSFASLLTRLCRYEEAVEHFYKVIGRADDMSFVSFGNVDKPLVHFYLRREIETLGGSVVIPQKVLAAYELILTLMKLSKIEKAQKVAFFLEKVVKKYPMFPMNELISHSMAGYAYKIIGNKEKAAKIFVSVLEKNPGHLPVIEALESFRLGSQPQEMG